MFLQGMTARGDASLLSAVAGCHPCTSSTTSVCWSKYYSVLCLMHLPPNVVILVSILLSRTDMERQ